MIKYLREISLKEDGFIFTQFQWFQFMVDWLHCFSPVIETEHHSKKCMWSKVAYLMVARNQREEKRKKERRGRDGDNIILYKGRPPVTYFLELGPTS
jgi:hypothetical protein